MIRDLWFTDTALALRCQLASCGRETVTDPAYNWDGMRREETPYLIVKHSLEGAGAFTFEGREHRVTPGTLMLVPVPHPNRYWLPAGGRWRFRWVCLHGSDVQQAATATIERCGPLIGIADDSLIARAMLECCDRVLGSEPVGAHEASALAYAVVMGLLDLGAASVRLRCRHGGIARALSHAQRELQTGIGVAGMAEAAGLSRHHFSRCFREEMGVSPVGWLSERRIERAAQLLREGESVAATTQRCGFSDASYFCKVFRKRMGMSPGAFRDSGMFTDRHRR